MAYKSEIMNTIDAFEADIARQPKYIKEFRAGLQIPKNRHSRTVFSGSGDSLAAAMLASAFSDYAIAAVDPLELAKNPEIAKNKSVYFVSVSGNTSANIRASRLFRQTIAITKNPNSRLGASCKKAICLSYQDSGIITSGSIGFIASALECISKAVSFDIKGVERIFWHAKKEASKIDVSGKVFFLGGQYTYPVAMYAAAKLYEIAGSDAHYERLEQFFHMGLFSTKKSDTVIIFEDKIARLQRLLQRLGLGVYAPKPGTKNKVGQVLFYAFLSQFVALRLARKKRQKECYFVLQKRLRDASSQTIY